MYYEINVAVFDKAQKYYSHLFATHPRSITTKEKLKEIYLLLESKFPKEDGYSITISYHPETGEYINPETFFDE